jgi:predicted  nucleic acid-binding Zn-ribbon protein
MIFLKGDSMNNKHTTNDYDGPITFSGDQKIKLSQIITEGMNTLHEIETLRDGLSDTIKAISEEMSIPSSILKKAIKVAHKAEFHKTKKDQELLETILETVGRTL